MVSAVAKSDRVSKLLRRAFRRLPAIGVLIVTTALVVIAIAHRGIEVTELDVDDGGIWVTKGSDLSLGHLNYDALTFDGFVSTPSAQVALGQDGRTVTIGDDTTHSVASVDVAAMKLGGATTLPEGSQVVQGATTIAVLDASAGYLWVGDANHPDSLKYEDTEAIADGLASGVVTVSTTGTVFAYAPQYATLTTVSRAGATWTASKKTIDGISAGDDLTITAVGDKPVIYDATTNSVVMPAGRSRALSGDDPRLPRERAPERLCPHGDPRARGCKYRGSGRPTGLPSGLRVRRVGRFGRCNPHVPERYSTLRGRGKPRRRPAPGLSSQPHPHCPQRRRNRHRVAAGAGHGHDRQLGSGQPGRHPSRLRGP